MKIAISQCGVLVDWKKCKKLYGIKTDYYGDFTKCPVCGCLVYEEDNTRCMEKFDEVE
jgi:hypothetical protein